ncbi:hypothetical protein NFI95_13265 [Acetobacteraceae bacterium KSS8]|uniref:Uncharacterized protein n=1 Tax=Endosaccharibacter trunci TaxID=2812733 RepID=A0ABT1W932_9PROT|nr:hypothetical protein [Acetobacteraceae bacterium KSS8]
METLRRERVRLRHLASSGLVLSLALGVVIGGATAEAAPAHHSGHAAPHPASSHGAPTAGGGWSPSHCGREPAPPTVETSTIARYNASIDAVTAYDQAARSYNSCVSRSATEEQTAISAQAKQRIDAIQAVSEAVQKRIAANFTALSAALKKGPPAH